jgi:16S rRNA (cytidine1402-2'-O)-methyltransferase
MRRKKDPMSRQPRHDLRRRQRRHRKLRYLRARLAGTTDVRARQRLIAKIKKVSPSAPVPEK